MTQKNLVNKDALSRLKKLAEGINIAIMETKLGQKPVHAIPMTTKEVDDAGCIWFFSNQNSEHNANLNTDNDVQLIYSNPGKMEFLIVYGHASVTKDRAVLKRYYKKTDDALFDGVDDPNLTAIQVTPQSAHYWETKHGKFVSFIKIGIGALTGNRPDVGEHGDLDV